MAAKTFDFSNRPKQQFTPADLPGLFSGLGNAAAPGTIVQLPLGKLIAWENQPFKPYSEAKMQLFVEDIKANGVLNPIIVRPKGEQYEILAGHNRWNASRKAGLETIPAIIMVVDDDTATLIMVNTNLNQRDELLPSEKAWAYRLQLEAMKRQAGRPTKENSSQIETQKRSDQQLAEQTGESRNQIQRYIRITYLIPELLEMVDQNMLPMMSGVSLSYLSKEEQHIACDISAECDKKISTAQAEKIKRLGQDGSFSAEAVRQILLPTPRWNAANAFSSRSKGLIPKTATEQDIERIVVLINEYFTRSGKEKSDA
ncbi:MAG: parB-like partition protein [Oscillospiraceae bacterium]|jgi:ParB family chromosome partitioning protein|nr:parB-like partition protein [Oscillospiraceae bacterium]